MLRWGSKLVNDGEITFYQFMVAFMGIYFSGMAAGTLFSFSGSKPPYSCSMWPCGTNFCDKKGFAKGVQAVNYYFWLLDLKPTMAELEADEACGPLDGVRTYEFKDVQFSYPLHPHHQVLNGVSLEVSAQLVRTDAMPRLTESHRLSI
jgi:ATP-binding cassette, subfamily B (MDR/TAP), member 1